MADDLIKALTTYTKSHEVELPKCKTTIKLDIPNSSQLIAAMDFIRKHEKDDLAVAHYILQHHCPDLKHLNDSQMDDLVSEMHYEDVATVILKFLNVDPEQVDPEQLRELFRRGEQDTPM